MSSIDRQFKAYLRQAEQAENPVRKYSWQAWFYTVLAAYLALC